MKKRSGFTVMAKLIGLVKPLSGYMAAAILMGLIGNLCASFITIFGGYAVLDVMKIKTPFSLKAIFAALILFAVVRGFLRYAEQACNHFIAFKLLALIRDKVFRALRGLCPAKLEGRDKGDLISVITSDIELLEVFYAHTISPAAIYVLYTIFMLLFIGSYSGKLCLIALLGYAAVGIVIPITASKLSGDSGDKFRNESGELSTFVLDSLRGLDEIIQFGNGRQRLDEMNLRTSALSSTQEKMKRISGKNSAATNTVILAFDLAMLFAAVSMYNKGTLDFSGVLICTIAMMSSFGPSVALANLGTTLQNTFAAGNRVLDILEEEPVVEEVTNGSTPEFENTEAENVVFSYGEGKILDNVNLKVEEGKIIGIVGKSGCGKSTLLKLFMRFWDVNGGSIKISDTDIRQIDTAKLRNMQSFVTQDTLLFHDSIKNNLKIAKLDATNEEIKAACKKASIHDFIESLPQKYDTPVGELGSTLSGGERQRLGLARAFLHGAPFMLLDEPTSSLDSLNEAVILKSLYDERGKYTILMVSHRKSTVKIADEVYSIEDISDLSGRQS